jgi:hypothetical protein
VTPEELYALLPAVYRIRDEQRGGPLRELVQVLAGTVAELDESLAQFYDDLFIETCADWVAPYIGDLVGYRPLYGVVPAVASPRAEVANTIRYRRRKGTAAMLEQLAHDVTGWPARAVEYFERLAVTQYLNHVRPHRGGTANLRDREALSWLGSAFDEVPHTADVRPVRLGAPRHNIRNVGLFLWRVPAIRLSRAPLTPHDGSGRRYRFDPLGADRQLYGDPRTEAEISHLAEPFDVPLPLGRRWFGAHRDFYYGPGRSVVVEVGGAVVGPPESCALVDLPAPGPGGEVWAHEPAPGSGALVIDPELGRVCFADPVAAPVTASFCYGAALESGGGGYDRPVPPVPGAVTVHSGQSLATALDRVADGGTVQLTDSARFQATTVGVGTAGRTLTVRAANRCAPVLDATGPVTLDVAPAGTVVLDGLILTGGALELPESADTEPRHLVLRHCTLRDGLRVRHPFATVTVQRCFLGPVVAVDGTTVTITDTVLDAGDAGTLGCRGGALDLSACTVIGAIQAQRVEISDSLLLGAVTVARRQEGCVRYSYLPDGSRTPRRYRCRTGDPGPRFTSLRFGHPGYAQLRVSTPDEIRRGASDEGEMGAGHYLQQPRRETNLLLRLDEYLRFGLTAGLIYAS